MNTDKECLNYAYSLSSTGERSYSMLTREFPKRNLIKIFFFFFTIRFAGARIQTIYDDYFMFWV